jgi:hypothetical protein
MFTMLFAFGVFILIVFLAAVRTVIERRKGE